jgi:hypothetical protein
VGASLGSLAFFLYVSNQARPILGLSLNINFKKRRKAMSMRFEIGD